MTKDDIRDLAILITEDLLDYAPDLLTSSYDFDLLTSTAEWDELTCDEQMTLADLIDC